MNPLSTDFQADFGPAAFFGLDEGQIPAHFEENVGQLFQTAPGGTALFPHSTGKPLCLPPQRCPGPAHGGGD